MKTFSALIALLSLANLAPAWSQTADSRFYVGVGAGRSSVDGPSQATPNIFLSSTPPASLSINGLPLDDDDTAWTAFVGYAATRYVCVEIGYWDHGTFSNDQLFGSEAARLDINEWYFGATLRYPFANRWALTGSAGISRAQFDVEGIATILILPPSTLPGLPSFPFPVRPPGGQPPSANFLSVPLVSPDDETGGYWRAGVDLRITDTVVAALNYSRHDVQVQKVETVSLSLRYAF